MGKILRVVTDNFVHTYGKLGLNEFYFVCSHQLLSWKFRVVQLKEPLYLFSAYCSVGT